MLSVITGHPQPWTWSSSNPLNIFSQKIVQFNFFRIFFLNRPTKKKTQRRHSSYFQKVPHRMTQKKNIESKKSCLNSSTNIKPTNIRGMSHISRIKKAQNFDFFWEGGAFHRLRNAIIHSDLIFFCVCVCRTRARTKKKSEGQKKKRVTRKY